MDTLTLTSPTLLIPVIATLAGAIGGAFLTFLLSIWRFRAEKRWEKRLEAYEKLIQALHRRRAFWSYEADIHADRADCETKVYDELHEKEKEARGLIGLAVERGFLVVGREVHDLLQYYAMDIVVNMSEKNALLRAEKAKELTNTCLKELIRLAQRELKRRVT